MLAIADQGGITIAQNEQSCVIFGMPQRAIEIKAASHILPLQDIASMLISTVAKFTNWAATSAPPRKIQGKNLCIGTNRNFEWPVACAEESQRSRQKEAMCGHNLNQNCSCPA